ncbi:MFS transporter [Dysgonomonas sp. 25]|uniref:MFS transporter n=1 Tax=Dysgonomonas sp. 25 TaxID=2302933 RepID=UPI0013D21DD1|nr:MFS transporter [Dysgonomonas sp. 25]NDV67418.1 MFS transporter [Dysgonomonas sp. 25]
MKTSKNVIEKMTNYRWTICALLFFATTINYLDRQVLSLLQPILEKDFHWTDSDYGTITSIFSLAYAISLLFAGRFIDKLGTKKGYAIAIAVWSFAACLHALCGTFTESILGISDTETMRNTTDATLIASIAGTSILMFVIARSFLAFGEAGNFPAAIKATADYFPKRDRAFATGIFNSGCNIGAILAPLTVPFIAAAWGWEMAFIIVGATGFIWLFFWLLLYKSPEKNNKMNDAERAYINQDYEEEEPTKKEEKVPFIKCFKYRQTWAFALGKFMTDGVWWFFLFWTPAYLGAEYGMETTDMALPIGILYTITVFGSVFGGKFPTYFINKGMNPYAGRMKAMLIIALFPILILLAQPLGHLAILGESGYWIPIILIGIGGSAHQAWSANIFSTVGDMFPKKAIATITGIGGMAGGLGSFFLQKGSGMLFDYSFVEWGTKSTGYSIVFTFCALAYIVGWLIMRFLVPAFKPIDDL